MSARQATLPSLQEILGDRVDISTTGQRDYPTPQTIVRLDMAILKDIVQMIGLHMLRLSAKSSRDLTMSTQQKRKWMLDALLMYRTQIRWTEQRCHTLLHKINREGKNTPTKSILKETSRGSKRLETCNSKTCTTHSTRYNTHSDR